MAFNVAVKKSPLLKSFNVSWIPSASVNTENLRVIEHPTLETAKRGTGYRSSFNGIVCTIFGGNGLIGRNVISRFGKHGTQLIIPHRCSWEYIAPSRVASDLGQMQFLGDFQLENEDSIRKAVKYSDVVINLIGRDYNTFNWPLQKVHVDGARRIARICREMGVKKLIHSSALNASPNPPERVIKGGSRFLKTKWQGELAVREEFPDAIIVRPSDVYGPEDDRFFEYYGSKRRLLWNNVLFLHNKGLDTYKQPVYVGDVAAGLYELAKRPSKDVAGKTYQFVGPKLYRLYDLCYYMYHHMYKDEEFFNFSIQDSRLDVFFHIVMTWHDTFYSRPKNSMCWERFERENISDQFDESLPHLRDLGVELSPFENYVWAFTKAFTAFATHVPETSEYQPPPDPPVFLKI